MSAADLPEIQPYVITKIFSDVSNWLIFVPTIWIGPIYKKMHSVKESQSVRRVTGTNSFNLK